MEPELSTTPVTMRRNRDRDRFELFTSDDEAFVGFLAYRVVDGSTLELQHTIISEDFSRRGFARTLVTHALDEIRAEGGRIVPTCTYVIDYLQRFPQYADLVSEK
ncbi:MULTISPECIES: GNAT family N-acetyltransferase [Brevibacterium]|uniref:GNAT family N-acetyltransferase n=1 Tax=Brevibacterium TaxID=1696 RepID=UPI0009270C9B|nr:GNAT family N-acetyltransferase [Brevibacterium casei]SIJ06628.1 acetyltransferase [Mycobacteroides abscessus subsp. abscessus]MCT1551192.1 N-acetyltransferase [Brevibacterium casei]MCT1560245.1 N-acetyltransferase [Brevibacterium casei]MCT2207500.1 N-acetyltransferase [Brevibacterium casei]MCT2357839.1 N-acetyltransferase [Brevibacterium casei]